MRVLVACEYSGTVRDAFIARGHDAISCDLLPTETPGPHYQGDVRDILGDGFDLCIAFPPCTDLAVSGARWMAEKGPERIQAALDFFALFLNAPIPRIAVENPVSIASTRLRPPTQVVHPWQHSHGESKATCLWLKNLPPLRPTNIVPGREPRVHMLPPGPDRWKERSRTYPGIAAAMADQWGTPTPVQLELGLPPPAAATTTYAPRTTPTPNPGGHRPLEGSGTSTHRLETSGRADRPRATSTRIARRPELEARPRGTRADMARSGPPAPRTYPHRRTTGDTGPYWLNQASSPARTHSQRFRNPTPRPESTT